MKRLIPLSIILMSSLLRTFAGEGGDGVGNGAGLAEKNIAFAWSNLGTYISSCLRAESCRLDATQIRILTRILEVLPEEKKAEKPIVFKSETEFPGFFLLDGQVRIAKTGSRVGDTIWFNRDLIYSTLPSGKIEALSVPAATALLIHELGHHQGEKDHSALDLIGAKVQNHMHGHSQLVNTWPYFESLWASTIRFESVETYSQILVWDDGHLLDLSPRIIQALRCPSLFPNSVPMGAAFLGLRWEPVRGMSRPGESKMVFKFSAITYCSRDHRYPENGGFSPIGGADIEVIVTLKVEYAPTGQRSELIPERTMVQVTNHGVGENCRTSNCTISE